MARSKRGTQAQIIREIAARMLAETDPKKLRELIKVLTRVCEVQLRIAATGLNLPEWHVRLEI